MKTRDRQGKMVDFRYHIVSLIAVFLALAIGIILGSGPLRDAFTGQMTGQYAQVQAERDELRETSAEQAEQQEKIQEYLNTNTQALSANQLAEENIAVVVSPEVDEADVEALMTALQEDASATPVSVTLTENWSDPEQRSFRQGISGLLVEHMDPEPGADLTLEEQLPMALAQALVQGADGNTTMLQILEDSELIAEIPELTALDGVIVVAGQAESDADDENVELRFQTLSNLVRYSADYTSGATLTLLTDGQDQYAQWLSGQNGPSHFAGPASSLTWTMTQAVLADSYAGNTMGYSLYNGWSNFGPETNE